MKTEYGLQAKRAKGIVTHTTDHYMYYDRDELESRYNNFFFQSMLLFQIVQLIMKSRPTKSTRKI